MIPSDRTFDLKLAAFGGRAGNVLLAYGVD